VAVPVQDVAESRATVAVVKAVEPAEATGVAAPEPNVAEATVVTLLRRIKKDAAEKNTYIGISFTHPQQGGITHLAAGYISRTPYLLLLLNSISSLEHSNGRYTEITEFKLILAIYHKRVSTVRADSQMTTGFFTLRPVKGWETNHSQMTTSFFMLQSWMLDSRFLMLGARCSNFVRFVLYSLSVP